MADVPVELVVAAFTDESGAANALKDLKEAKKEKLIGIQDAAVIRRDQSNKVHISETGDMSGGRGAAIGGAVGAAIGLLTGPGAIITGAVGATIGGLAARLRDSGFPDDRLREIGQALKPGTSALVAVIEHTWVAQLEQELAAQGAQVMTETIQADIAQQLEAGRDVTYTTIATEDTVVFGRTTEEAEQAKAGEAAPSASEAAPGTAAPGAPPAAEQGGEQPAPPTS